MLHIIPNKHLRIDYFLTAYVDKPNMNVPVLVSFSLLWPDTSLEAFWEETYFFLSGGSSVWALLVGKAWLPCESTDQHGQEMRRYRDLGWVSFPIDPLPPAYLTSCRPHNSPKQSWLLELSDQTDQPVLDVLDVSHSNRNSCPRNPASHWKQLLTQPPHSSRR